MRRVAFVLLVVLITSGAAYEFLQLGYEPSATQSSSREVISVEIELSNPVTKVSCGPDLMVIEHGSPGQPGYTKKVYSSSP